MSKKPNKVICTGGGCGKMASYVGKGTVERPIVKGSVTEKVNFHKCDTCGARTWRFA